MSIIAFSLSDLYSQADSLGVTPTVATTKEIEKNGQLVWIWSKG